MLSFNDISALFCSISVHLEEIPYPAVIMYPSFGEEHGMHELRLAENLKALREANGYKQETVSSYIHVQRQTYSKYERNLQIPSLEIVCSLAELYHIPLDLLLYIDLTCKQIADAPVFGYTTDAAKSIPFSLSGADARMLMNYKSLPPKDQEEAREYMLFKKNRWEIKKRRKK